MIFSKEDKFILVKIYKSYLNDSIVEKSLENVSGNYINNITNEKEEELSCLERYKVDNQTYNIGGILISRPKVSRYYRGNLLEAILYGSIKTLEECETLTTELNQRKELSLEKTVAKQ